MTSGQTIFHEECLRCDRRADAFKEAFHASPDALQLFSPDRRIIDVNPVLTNLCQFTRAEVLDMDFSTLFPRTGDYITLLSEERLSPHCPLFSFSTLMQTRHDGGIPVDIAVSPIPSAPEATPVFQAQIRAPGPAARGAAGANAIPARPCPRVGISRSAPWPEGRYLETNDAMSALLGYTAKALSAFNTLTLITDPKQSSQIFREISQGRPVRDLPLRVTHKNGDSIQVFYTAKPVIDPATGAPALDEIMVEALPSGPMDAAGRTADRLRAIGALAGGIAHNFNNILTGIYGNITLARMELSGETHARHYLERAENSMEEAVRLTRQLLTFAKGGDPVKEIFNPAHLFQDIIRFNLSGSRVKLVFKAPEDLWPVHGDKDQIAQVITHIVTNARQAMPEGGTLDVDMENTHLIMDNLLTIAKGAYLKIRFKDHGNGISQNDLDRIFDPYFTTKPDGNGMGLSICYSIVNKHHGHISVSSQLGIGTAITVYLPAISNETPKEDTVVSETSDAGKKAKILVMDDEAHIRTITQKMLEKFGHSVVLTEDGKEAVAAYADAMENSAPFDLVIMDLTIPGGMGGQEASRIILEMDPEAKVVVSSGYSNDKVMADYKTYGLKGIIPKPFRLSELKATIEQLIA